LSPTRVAIEPTGPLTERVASAAEENQSWSSATKTQSFRLGLERRSSTSP
jgi:hypothetical protein